ncbi:cuticle protein 19.8 [Drosophila kikkawai]|uniref:Cuticle protein 19.8 n=1 Tax=Drosophila kikkawai TaxID=30033 RepID=A0A6P4JCC7_DROKI|nr:cuticle protein 19.8 [Drosophila kikkawai]
MAGKFLTGVALILAIAGSCRAGFAATYAGYHPAYATYQAPAVYHAAPVVHAPAVYHQAAPVLTKTVVPAAAPLYTKAYAVPSPFVKAAVAAPLPVPVAAPVVKTVAPVAVAAPVLKQVEYESSPRYDFSYGVHDSITGDIKSQVETRDGGNVVGSYSVLDADGFKRTVTYTADDINGFNAVVQREPVVAARALATPVAVAAPAPVAVAAPAPVAVAAPAPVAVAAPAPVASFQSPIYYPHQQVFAPQQVQPVAEQQGEVVEAPVATPPELEPTPIDYNEGQEQQQQQTYPQDQQFPPFSPAPAPESDDSDVVEARSVPEASSTTSTTAAPVTEETKKSA